MEDSQLINLYFERSEAAIEKTEIQYGKYCLTIARNVLHNEEDAEECVNDAYLAAWNAIPPAKPDCFRAFIGKITRNIALDRYDKQTAAKRGGGEVTEAIDEFAETLPAKETVESQIEGQELGRLINSFLTELPKEKRVLFVRRYWYLSSIEEISDEYGLSKSNVKTSLLRIREKLKEYLNSQGYAV